ncbi:MAG: hypothetical protein COU46_03615 [Candidatus Niyogibacteria bacterium CG10_big_fil_rev_8_21_14_0_10_42_19]|uniref:Uncharacterized protein n=1 Tax=Candidatus Niyogibacteria bacterium CG10_big_fil_rev_8_21_14_0_10_42_19 TaxID=1974725 RepID=A0A2H0TGF9_9BACT|nr:MAG: hypothetical protein COU46_03615 [Candidatus Niyogibacteria bacterium CG10_big_fil_rev_8_21_14_0_10_42_19]
MKKIISPYILASLFLFAGLVSYFYIGVNLDTGIIIGLFFFGLGLGVLLGQDMEKRSPWIWGKPQ